MTTFSFSKRTVLTPGPTGYDCPACHRPGTKVLDSRRTEEGWIRRRRKCQTASCDHRFTTIENEGNTADRERTAIFARIMKHIEAVSELADLLTAEHEP